MSDPHPTSEDWVACKDRLPSDNESVLVWSPDKNGESGLYFIAFFAQGSLAWYMDDEDHPTTVMITHWRDLPEPPK